MNETISPRVTPDLAVFSEGELTCNKMNETHPEFDKEQLKAESPTP